MRTGSRTGDRSIGAPTIRRLPLYLDALLRCRRNGQKVVSTTALSAMVGFSDPVVKKDLNTFGAPGKTGVGYAVDPLLRGIERFLGWDNPSRAVLVGVGDLGMALLGREGVRGRHLHIVAAFDVDSDLFGTNVDGVTVYDVDRMIEITRGLGVDVGVLTVPEHAAQAAANRLAAAGVTKIWSFSPISLDVPPGVAVKREFLSSGLAELTAGAIAAGSARKNGTRKRRGA